MQLGMIFKLKKFPLVEVRYINSDSLAGKTWSFVTSTSLNSLMLQLFFQCVLNIGVCLSELGHPKTWWLIPITPYISHIWLLFAYFTWYVFWGTPSIILAWPHCQTLNHQKSPEKTEDPMRCIIPSSKWRVRWPRRRPRTDLEVSFCLSVEISDVYYIYI